MGLKYSGGLTVNQLALKLQGVPQQLQTIGERIVTNVTAQAEVKMREYIEERGTGWNGHKGRINTGEMLEAVSHAVINDKKTVTGKWGWGLENKAVPIYYKAQEGGFVIWNSGHKVQAMNALLDSYVWAVEELLGELRSSIQ